MVAGMQASQGEAEERHRVALTSSQSSAAVELRSLRQSLETDKKTAVERLQAEREEAEEGMRRDMKAALLEAETHAAAEPPSPSAESCRARAPG